MDAFVRGFEKASEWITAVVFYSVPVADVQFPLIVGWLVVAGLFFTIWLKFMNLRGFKLAIDLVRGKYTGPDEVGEVSHFQALATAVSGTVGLGNIAGVAVAITIGGPGATFWMIICGLLGMSTKMAECMLGVKYRREHADGSVSGGPMFYLTDGMKALGLGGLGRVLAVFFAICMIGASLGGGNMFQSNQAAAQIIGVTGGAEGPLGGYSWAIGVAFAVLVGVVIIGGIKSIAKVTEKVVPFMGVLYVSSCLLVIFFNVPAIPSAIGEIFAGAFTGAGAAGGVIGALITGFQRAAFSNEAGLGSSATAHSAVKTKEPATEGYVASLEPFIDTVVVCTMTALTIVVTGAWKDPSATEVGGVVLTSRAFETVLPWFPVVLSVAVVLFAFSTMLSWSYYGMKATAYLFGDSHTAENVYKVVFCVFTAIGAAAALEPVINFSDSMIFLLGLANIIGLYCMAKVIRREILGYHARIKSGEVRRLDKASH